MFLEAIVTTVCLAGQPGCSSATTAYYEQNKELKESVKHMENMGKRIIEGNEYIVYAATPVYAAFSGKSASIKLTGHLNLNVNVRDRFFGLQWNY